MNVEMDADLHGGTKVPFIIEESFILGVFSFTQSNDQLFHLMQLHVRMKKNVLFFSSASLTFFTDEELVRLNQIRQKNPHFRWAILGEMNN